MRKKYWTKAQIEKAIYLHDKLRIPWALVAERFNANKDSLEQTVWRYRNGFWANKREEWIAQRNEIARLFEVEGLRVVQIAQILGVTSAAICQRLDDIGLDREERQIIREKFKALSKGGKRGDSF